MRSHYLFYPCLIVLSITPAFFFISHQIVGKSFKFVSPNKRKFSNWIEFLQFSLSLSIDSGPSLGEISKQFLYKHQYQPILMFLVILLGMIRWNVVFLILIQKFRWSNVRQRKRKKKQKLRFWYSHFWPYVNTCLHSYSDEFEQVMTHYDCFEEVSVQFLSTDTKQKVGTLDKSYLF